MNATHTGTLLRSGSPRARRGSALLVTLLFALIVGISLMSFLSLSNNSLNMAQRNFLDNAAMNLCELGLENALLCVNRNQTLGVDLATAWSGWTIRGADACRRFAGNSPTPGATSVIRVYVRNYDLGGPPLLVSMATVQPGDGSPPLSKYVSVGLAHRNAVSGMIVKTRFTADSGTYFDSWNSTPSAGTFAPYSRGVARAHGMIGAIPTTDGVLNLGNEVTMYGTLNTGGGSPTWRGSSVLSDTVGGSGWNGSLINRSFSYNFPVITVPTPSRSNPISSPITSSVAFPRPGDLPASDGKYYYTFAPGVGISLAAKTLTINQPSVFLMTSHGGTNVLYSSDHATFTYGVAGALDLYTDGNINIDSGANFFVNKAPGNTNLYGTNLTSQTFVTRGGGTFYANIIAENARVTFDSGVSIMGAMSVYSMTLLGACAFHYDEALGLGKLGGYKPTQWKELKTAAERSVYSAQLSF